MNVKEWTFTLADIDSVAQSWLRNTQGYTVFAFHGLMGAGKTTFIHALCQAKGVEDPVGSPTFSLVNEYRTGSGKEEIIYHMDLYRLADEAEALQAGIEEYLYSGATCFVEWPEKAPGLFPAETVHVFMEVLDTLKRRVKIEIPTGN
jgi:tRNA threonylcarbamoyladenosine biosynthesis protein TsaE